MSFCKLYFKLFRLELKIFGPVLKFDLGWANASFPLESVYLRRLNFLLELRNPKAKIRSYIIQRNSLALNLLGKVWRRIENTLNK